MMKSVLKKSDFYCPKGTYLLSHSVGRPFRSLSENIQNTFYSPWQSGSAEPWGEWLEILQNFRLELAKLFCGEIEEFCPQVNLSSSLTKIVQSHHRLARNPVILMSEQDFPSMGFVLNKAPLEDATIRLLPKECDVSDPNVWQDYLRPDIDLVFVSHAYSNLGQKAPIEQVIKRARQLDIISIVDVAQSAGIIELNLTACRPDFMIGSCVKWLCGGPGAGYLWVNPEIVDSCHPKDVGWFSHENPFEFDLNNFRYHGSALRFWGGTPSVAPYAAAAHSIARFNLAGLDHVMEHNQVLIEYLISQMGEWIVSPHDVAKRSGTVIVRVPDSPDFQEKLKSNQIWVDQRQSGLRVSPHIYNSKQEMDLFTEQYLALCG